MVKKRLIALLLALSMVMSCLCVTGFATERNKLSVLAVNKINEDYSISEEPITSVSKGDLIAVMVGVKAGSDGVSVCGYQFELAFDDNVLELWNQTTDRKRSFYTNCYSKDNISSNAFLWPEPTMSSSAGRINLAATYVKTVNDYTELNCKANANGSIDIIQIAFKVKDDAENCATKLWFDSDYTNKLIYYAGAESSTTSEIDFDKEETYLIVNGVAPTLNAIKLDNGESKTVNVVGGNSAGQTVQATATSAKGTDITNQVDWSISPEGNDVSIDSNGLITVANNAKADNYTITAAPKEGVTQGERKTATLTVTRETSVATTVTVSGGTKGLLVPANSAETNGTAEFTATVEDQYGEVMSDPNITWTVTGDGVAVGGVSIANGTVTVTNAAKTAITDTTGKMFTVTATCGEKSGTANLTVKRAAAKAAEVTVAPTDDTTLTIPADGGNPDATAVFTATVKDQYGTEMNDPDVTWSVSSDNATVAGVSIANGTVTVTNDAKAAITDTTGKTFTVTAACGEKSGTANLTVKRANPTVTTVKVYRGGVEKNRQDTVHIPGTGSTTYTYAAKAFDQYGAEMKDLTSTVSITQNGETISNGTLTIANTVVSNSSFNLTATCGGKTTTLTITATNKKSDTTTMKVTQAGFTYSETDKLNPQVSGVNGASEEATFSYKVKDGASIDTPTNAGTYTVTATYETEETIYTASADFTIAPKSITGATVTLGNGLTYDGTVQTQNVSAVKLGDTTLDSAADYTLSNNTATNAGSYNLTVTGKGNYTGSVQWAFTVAKKSITPNVDVTGTYTYTGSAITPTVTVKNGETPLAATDYALEYSNNTNAGEATVTAKAKANGNYSFTDTERKFNIAKADYLSTKTANASAKYGAAGALDLNSVLNPTAGWTFDTPTVTDASGILVANSVTVDNGKLNFRFVNDSSKVDSNATVEIPVTSTNYNNFDLVVTLTVLAKTAQTLSAESLNKTYGDTFTASVSGAQTAVTYSVKSGNESLLKYEGGKFTAIGVGEATIVATAVENAEYASATKEITVTIAKRALTVKADNKTAYIGDKQPELTYTVSGLVNGDKLTTVPTLKLVHDANVDPMKQAGTYEIVFETAPAASDNYALSAQTGTLTVSARPSYVGPTGNAVSVDRTENGKISVSPARAAKGTTVTITVTPDKGQELKSLEVIDQNGNLLPLTDLGNGKFSFVMPAGKVSIKSEFGEENTYVNPYGDVQTRDWFFDAVQYVTENGLMNGTGIGFEPNLATSRAMIWTILARMSGVNTASGSEWYAIAQQWAVANGVSDGTMPNDTITREQLAAMLYRYTVSKGLVKGPATADLSVFADADSVSSYAVEAMQWAVSVGLINGMDGKLCPQGSATRAQVATMLMRFDELTK